MRRRTFLLGAAAVAVGGALVARLPAPHTAWLDASARDTLSALYAQLWPAGNGAPGADELGVVNYLLRMLAAPRVESWRRDYVRNGVGWLNEQTLAGSGRRLEQLDPVAQGDVLTAFAATGRGESWLAHMLGYLFESLLGDPAYGVNPEGHGWRWLAHTPGFPRPGPGQLFTDHKR